MLFLQQYLFPEEILHFQESPVNLELFGASEDGTPRISQVRAPVRSTKYAALKLRGILMQTSENAPNLSGCAHAASSLIGTG